MPKKTTKTKTKPKRAAKSVKKSLLVEVKRSKVQGRGVFARRAIANDTRIIEYVGVRMSPDAADDTYDDEAMKRHHTFLFDAGPVLIDGSRSGNESRFINHSCDPNCYAEITKPKVYKKRARVFIRAWRDIAKGEELFYDYWYSTDPSYTDEDLRRIYPCRCGSPKCRGTLAAPRKKPRAVKAAVKGKSTA